MEEWHQLAMLDTESAGEANGESVAQFQWRLQYEKTAKDSNSHRVEQAWA